MKDNSKIITPSTGGTTLAVPLSQGLFGHAFHSNTGSNVVTVTNSSSPSSTTAPWYAYPRFGYELNELKNHIKTLGFIDTTPEARRDQDPYATLTITIPENNMENFHEKMDSIRIFSKNLLRTDEPSLEVASIKSLDNETIIETYIKERIPSMQFTGYIGHSNGGTSTWVTSNFMTTNNSITTL